MNALQMRREVKQMNYRLVIEEQIEELQNLQKEVVEKGSPETACEVARTITGVAMQLHEHYGD